MARPSSAGSTTMDVWAGSDRSPSRSPRSRSRSASDTVRITRAGRPTATTSLGRSMPAGTSAPSPRNTRSPSRAPGMRMEALPISQRSPTVAPMTRQRCPKVVRRPIAVGIVGVPMTTQFSITAEPVPIDTPRPDARTTAPSDSSARRPKLGRPMTTADDAIRGATSRSSTGRAVASVLLMGGRTRRSDRASNLKLVYGGLESSTDRAAPPRTMPVMARTRRRMNKGEARWLTRDQELAWRSLASMVHQLRAALECQLERDADLSFIEYHALARLSEDADHRLRMSELAALTNASLSRVSHLIKLLESWGYVQRAPVPIDGSFTTATLTEPGYAKLVLV